MNKKNLFKKFFLLIVIFFVGVDYCIGQKKSILSKIATSKEAQGFVTKSFRKIISADQDSEQEKTKKKKKPIHLTIKQKAEAEKKKIEAQLKQIKDQELRVL